MTKSTTISPEKIRSAKEAITDCLAGVEAAIEDLKPNRLLIVPAAAVQTAVFRHRLQNRILLVALSLQRLEDGARRLFKRLNHDSQTLNQELQQSIPIRVIRRLANSWKHGLGGQQRNSTFLNGVLSVHRSDGFPDETGQDRVHVLGMLVTDGGEGVFVSSTLLFHAVRKWGALLQPVLPDAPAWAARIFPEPKGQVIQLPQGVKAVVPLGATVVSDLPDLLQSTLTVEANRRADSA